MMSQLWSCISTDKGPSKCKRMLSHHSTRRFTPTLEIPTSFRLLTCMQQLDKLIQIMVSVIQHKNLYGNTCHLLNPPKLAQFISQYFYSCKSSATRYPEKPFQGGWLFLRGSRYILGYLGDNGPQKYGTKIIIFRAKKIESQIICKTIERNFKGMVHQSNFCAKNYKILMSVTGLNFHPKSNRFWYVVDQC